MIKIEITGLILGNHINKYDCIDNDKIFYYEPKSNIFQKYWKYITGYGFCFDKHKRPVFLITEKFNDKIYELSQNYGYRYVIFEFPDDMEEDVFYIQMKLGSDFTVKVIKC